jgi:2-polyprenyl-3-methyl-5-hydroxy-6-metoxy-1,4-benzoquinol methylase
MTRDAALVTEAISLAMSRMREVPDIETSSEAYAQRFAGPVGAWFLRVQEQAVHRMLAAWPAATILEVGGGHGQLTSGLVRQGHRVTVLGSDVRCRQRIKGLVDQGLCRFVTGDLLALPYPPQSFDVVVSIRLLSHVDAWSQFIQELTRVARYAVVVDYPPRRSLNVLFPVLFGAKKRLEGNTRPYRVFRESPEVIAAFANCGFTLRQRCPQFFWPMVLHRVLGQPGISQALEAPCRGAMRRWFGSPVVALLTRKDEP